MNPLSTNVTGAPPKLYSKVLFLGVCIVVEVFWLTDVRRISWVGTENSRGIFCGCFFCHNTRRLHVFLTTLKG